MLLRTHRSRRRITAYSACRRVYARELAATTILQNLAPMNDLLAQSWKRSPAGTSPKVDQVRRRVENIVDLQRAVANQEVRFGGFAVDNDGMDLLGAASAASPPALPEDDPRIPSAMHVALSAKQLVPANP